MVDEVVIRVPLSTRHIGLVRATASSLAARADFTYDQITDLHVAIDEACSRIRTASESGGAASARLEVVFRLEEGGLTVSARGSAPLKEGKTLLNSWSEMIMNSVTSRMEVSSGTEGTHITFRVGGEDGR